MQINVNQMSLTNAVASNRPAIAQGLSAPELSRPVIEQDAVAALNLDGSSSPSAKNLQSRLGAQLEYEQDTRGHQGAIAQYLQTQHAAKREEIQQMVGVDVYA
ncbi:hypothetical protein [Shewanella sp. HN-41]|uniref:hypothetical protein n=1 Tax=Shewanella sp. HN-41 TaxID=327275 RepID=UPI0002125F20|nr:hypothetical protein [Shewanella sp. HN-41]EGM69874.1 hypothetical protein SOHN41_02135 [Shewanella sp. HN-41]